MNSDSDFDLMPLLAAGAVLAAAFFARRWLRKHTDIPNAFLAVGEELIVPVVATWAVSHVERRRLPRRHA
jgi:hypothetical protein